MKIFNNEFLDNKRINVLPFRSHFIPFKKDDKVEYFHGAIKKNSSSLVYSLNGTWNFKEYKKKRCKRFCNNRFDGCFDCFIIIRHVSGGALQQRKQLFPLNEEQYMMLMVIF